MSDGVRVQLSDGGTIRILFGFAAQLRQMTPAAQREVRLSTDGAAIEWCAFGLTIPIRAFVDASHVGVNPCPGETLPPDVTTRSEGWAHDGRHACANRYGSGTSICSSSVRCVIGWCSAVRRVDDRRRCHRDPCVWISRPHVVGSADDVLAQRAAAGAMSGDGELTPTTIMARCQHEPNCLCRCFLTNPFRETRSGRSRCTSSGSSDDSWKQPSQRIGCPRSLGHDAPPRDNRP